MITLLKEKTFSALGFGKAAAEVTFCVDRHASMEQLFKEVPREGFFYIDHTEIERGNEGNRRELCVFHDGKVVFSEESDPKGLDYVLPAHIRTPTFSKPDTKKYIIPTHRYCLDDGEGVFELIRTDEEGVDEVFFELRSKLPTSVGLEDLFNKAEEHSERVKTIPGITTSRPKGFLNNLLHAGCVKITKVISPSL